MQNYYLTVLCIVKHARLNLRLSHAAVPVVRAVAAERRISKFFPHIRNLEIRPAHYSRSIIDILSNLCANLIPVCVKLIDCPSAHKRMVIAMRTDLAALIQHGLEQRTRRIVYAISVDKERRTNIVLLKLSEHFRTGRSVRTVVKSECNVLLIRRRHA